MEVLVEVELLLVGFSVQDIGYAKVYALVDC